MNQKSLSEEGRARLPGIVKEAFLTLLSKIQEGPKRYYRDRKEGQREIGKAPQSFFLFRQSQLRRIPLNCPKKFHTLLRLVLTLQLSLSSLNGTLLK